MPGSRSDARASRSAVTRADGSGVAPGAPPERVDGVLRRATDERYRWVAVGVVLMGSFVVVLDTTIVNVALPQIGIALGRQSGIEWIVTAYLLAFGVCQPAIGWLADRFGRKRVFIVSLGVFTLGSLLAASAPNLEVLVAFRVVQGLGGGGLVPVGMAIVYEAFPPDRRGTALGLWGVAAMAGPAFGPVVGGYLVTSASWHWLFLVNLPIGMIGMVAAGWLLRDAGYREARPLDAAGLAQVTAALVLWLLAFAQAGDWGWQSPATVGLLAGGAVLFGVFIRREGHVPHPAIDVRMFQVGLFSHTMVIIAMLVVVQFGILVFLPLQLQTVHGLTALHVGTLLMPMAAGAALTFFLGGRLTDRIGPRLPAVAGSLLLAMSAWMLGHLRIDSHLAVVEVAVVLQGLGFGFAMVPSTVAGMNALPHRFVAQAAAVRQLNVRVAASFGIAILAAIVAMRMGAVSPAGPHAIGAETAEAAYNTVFLIIAGIGAVAAVLGVFLPGSRRTREMQELRAREQDEVPLEFV